VLRSARVRHQADDEKSGGHDEDPLNDSSHRSSLHSAAEMASTITDSALSSTSSGQTQRR
jgi:hypothetical protein